MIIGHERQLKILDAHVRGGKISHAYLFSGPEHVGKHTIALAFMKSLACLGKRDKRLLSSCGACEACRGIENGTYPDMYRLGSHPGSEEEARQDEHEKIRIDDVRALKERAAETAFREGYKLFLIDDAADMGHEAANSLLKLLEEPPGKSVIILISRDASRMLSTIRSRVWQIKFWPVSDSLIKEGVLLEAKKRKAELIAFLAGGRPGIAVSYSLKKDAELEELFEGTEKLSKAVFSPFPDERFSIAAGFEDRGEYERACDDMVALLRRAMLETLGLADPGLSEHRHEAAASRCGRMIRKIIGQKISFAALYENPRVVFESILLNL